MEVEQSLMEGAFSKVWHSRVNVPAKEYLYFIDILMGTIRWVFLFMCGVVYCSAVTHHGGNKKK